VAAVADHRRESVMAIHRQAEYLGERAALHHLGVQAAQADRRVALCHNLVCSVSKNLA
jgi:hypothetical protein